MKEMGRYAVGKIQRFVDTALNRIESGLMFVAMLSLLVMMVLVTGNAVGRYLFNEPIPGTYELTELYLMPLAIFFTAAHLQKNEGNINVDVLYDRFPTDVKTGIDLVGRILAIIVFTPIAIWAGREFWSGYSEGATSVGVIEFPIYLSWFIMSVGLLFLSIRLLFLIKTDVVGLYRSIGGEDVDEVMG